MLTTKWLGPTGEERNPPDPPCLKHFVEVLDFGVCMPKNTHPKWRFMETSQSPNPGSSSHRYIQVKGDGNVLFEGDRNSSGPWRQLGDAKLMGMNRKQWRCSQMEMYTFICLYVLYMHYIMHIYVLYMHYISYNVLCIIYALYIIRVIYYMYDVFI